MYVRESLCGFDFLAYSSVDLNATLVVKLLFVVVEDSCSRFGSRLEISKRYFFCWIRKPVLEALKFLVVHQANPIDHIFILSSPAPILSVHLLVRAIVLEKVSDVVRILWHLCITKEMYGFLHFIADPSNLV